MSIVCDAGNRFASSYFEDCWRQPQGFDIQPHVASLETILETGNWNY